MSKVTHPEEEDDDATSPSSKRIKLAATAGEGPAPTLQPLASKYPPLSIEPCTMQKMKDHVTLLKSEVEEYQELLRSKLEEVAMVEGRIEYLRSINARKNQKKTYKRCSVEGCTKFAQKAGVCNVHGAGKMARICTVDGCSNHAKLRGGVCRRHGERKICTIAGCKSLVTKGTYCNEHRTDGYEKKPQKVCNYEGCNNKMKKGGFCRRHFNESRVCTNSWCKNIAEEFGGKCGWCVESEKVAGDGANPEGSNENGTAMAGTGENVVHHPQDLADSAGDVESHENDENVASGSQVETGGDTPVNDMGVSQPNDEHDATKTVGNGEGSPNIAETGEVGEIHAHNGLEDMEAI